VTPSAGSLEVVGGITEKQDVAELRLLPVVIGVGEEVPDGLGPRFSVPKLVEDVFRLASFTRSPSRARCAERSRFVENAFGAMTR
jgi:hypothetical protein